MRTYLLVLAALILGVSGCRTPPSPAAVISTASSGSAPPTVAPPADLPPSEGSNASQGCYYVWATRELSALSAVFSERLAAGSPSLKGSAYAFGEECHADSGEVRFLSMETDFRVQVAVSTLKDEAALGDAIQAAMLAVDSLPADKMPGTRAGRVEFEFTAADSQSLRLNIDIGRYRQEAAGREGADLFRYFSPPG